MWWLFSKKESSEFSACSTAEEVTQGIDGSALTAIITGATGGIGTETARVLALRGVHVIMGARNMVAAGDVKSALIKEIPTAKVDALELDLSSIASVRNFASSFISSGLPLNILVNNAGVSPGKFTLSKDNVELHFATNHLGHFLLTNLLLDTLKSTAHKIGRKGRIINVSSEAHRVSYRGGIRFDRINDPLGYVRFLAYCQSKLANVLHANELARRLKDEGANVTVNSLHPGMIPTNLFFLNRNSNSALARFVKFLLKGVLKDVQQGAATTCYAALHPEVEGISGAYFVNSSLGEAGQMARDVNLANRLWDFSNDLVNK